MHRLTQFTFLIVLLSLPLIARAENWPQWRGPSFNGSSTETALPSTCSKTENVAWVAPMPGPSGATPIIWEDRVFVSSADAKTKDLLALCINRKDGKVLWQKQIAEAADRRPHERKSNMCSPSPVTDGKSVFFLYGTGDLAAFDMDGNPLWTRNFQKEYGKYAIMWGYGSSPLLYKEKLYIPILQRDKQTYIKGSDLSIKIDSFVLAIDPKTGKDVWKQVRQTEAKDETREWYGTPIPFEAKDHAEVLISDGDWISGHNPESGAELWRFGPFNPAHLGDRRMVVSPVVAAGLVLAATPKHEPFYAIQPGSSSNPAAVAWKFAKEFCPDVATPLFYKDKIFVLDGDKKTMSCLDPKTGTLKWQGKVPGTAVYNASPTGADDKIFCMNEAGDVTILSAGDEFKILSTAPFGDAGACSASISVAGGSLFIRAPQNLYCVRSK